MADLLECLIQIKGVADTPRRLGLRAGAAVAALRSRGQGEAAVCASIAALTVAEPHVRACLELMLARDRPELPRVPSLPNESAGSVEDWLERFARERSETVRALEACTAEDLNRVGIEPSRGPMTVADLVALLLARDTDHLGRLIDLERGQTAGEARGREARLGRPPAGS